MSAPHQYWNLLLLPLLLILVWVYLRITKRFSNRQRLALAGLVGIYLAIQILQNLAFGGLQRLSSNYVVHLASMPISLAAQAIVVVAGILFLRFWRPELFVLEGMDLPGRLRDLTRDQLDLVLRSDQFLTALNESLPKGAADEEHGLDYVPYLLQAIRHRRQRFDVAARRFLWITFVIGFISATIIAGFGWILLNDSSVGAPRELRDARVALEDIAATARNISTNYKDSAEFNELRRAVYSPTGNGMAPVQAELQSMTERMVAPQDLNALLARLEVARRSITPRDESERLFVEGLSKAGRDLDSWQRRQTQLAATIARNNERVARLLSQMELSVGKDSTRVAELLRRLAIGVIVTTFFLVLMRLSGTLYRADYNEVLRADLDDMIVRTFYISYKAAGSSEAQRAAVLASLVTTMSAARAATQLRERDGTSSEELGVVKELISAAAKKL